MTIKIGDKIGSFIIESLTENTATGACQVCGRVYTIDFTDESELIELFEKLSCNENGNNLIDYNLYVGKKIGSFIILEYTKTEIDGQEFHSMLAECLHCKERVRATNLDNTEDIVKALLVYSCSAYIPETDAPLNLAEMQKIKRAKHKITYFIDKNAAINNLLKEKEQQELNRLVQEFLDQKANQPDNENKPEDESPEIIPPSNGNQGDTSTETTPEDPDQTVV